MIDLIIEACGTREIEDPNSVRLVEVPVLRVVYLETDEDTGARYCKDILEIDMDDLDPFFHSFYTIDTHEVESIELRDVTAPADKNTIDTFAGDPKERTLSRVLTYYLCIVKAQHLGWLDDNGYINKGAGKPLLQAYREQPVGDHSAYVFACRG